MADQQLDVFGGDDEDEKLHQALSEFKGLVRELVASTGLSANQLGDRHGFGKGKVSIWQTAKREQPNIPPLRFVEILIKEAEEAGHLQPGPAEAFLRQYGALLELYCARVNPHDVHRKMLADYQDTLLIRDLNAARNAVLAEVSMLTAELEALRGDRDEERRRRIALQQKIDSLQSENASLMVEKNAAVTRRNQIRAELTSYENGQHLVPWQPPAERGDSHANQAPAAAPVPPSPPSASHGRRRRGLVASLITLGAAVLVPLAVYGTTQLIGHRDQDRPDTPVDSRPRSSASLTPSTSSSAPPLSAPSATASASTSASATLPKTVTPHAGEPLPMVLTPPECDTVVEIDFDKVPFTTWVAVADGEEYEAPAGMDMTWTSCSSEKLRTRSGRHAGLIRSDQDVTQDGCRAAANGGGLENVKMWSPEDNPGFVEGATMCVITDQDRLVAAEVIDMDDEDAFSFTFNVKTLT